MKLRRHAAFCALLAVVAVAVGGLTPAAWADAPWQKLAVFRGRVADDPELDLAITEQNGPWMILAVTFIGDDAEANARKLATELRGRWGLDAYTHAMQFDIKDPYSRGDNGYQAVHRRRYQRSGSFREVAVLVGNYSTVDDPQAQKVLRRVKYLRPSCLADEMTDPGDGRPLAGLRMMHQQILADGNPKKEKGPMGHAFVTTNPLLPREYFVPEGPDEFVIALNRELDFSLLKCPGKFTVKVATFTGYVTHNQKEIREINRGRQMKSRLEEAEKLAHRMTRLLRSKGVEAYEFHSRHASIVTVGSFNSVGTPRADGKIEIHPGIHKIIETYGANRQAVGQAATPAARIKEIDGIPFDVQPIVVEAPKAPIGSQYAGRMHPET